MIDNEDLDALKKRKLKLIFILGGPGAGKGTYCQKLVSDFKYNHISTGDLLRDEIKRKSKIGLECEPYTSKGQLVPFNLIVKVLVKAILERSGQNFLIDGFPRSLEQALYLDRHIKEMKIILNVFADDEVMKKRLLNRGKSSGRKDDSDEKIILDRIKVFKQESFPAIDFYQKYGIVRDINSNYDVNTCYANLLDNLLPEIYCVIGKRYSGKSTVCSFLEKRINGKVINFNDFLKEKNISKFIDNNEFVISSFIQKLRDDDENRVIIEDFPLKQEYNNLFVRNGKAFRKLFYLNCEDNNCTIRMKEMGKDNKNYVGCAQLKNENSQFDSKRELLEMYKKKGNMIEINANNSLEIVFEDILNSIKPEIYMFSSDNESTNLKFDLMSYFQNQLNFEIVDVTKIIEETISRGTKLGLRAEESKKNGRAIPNHLINEILRPVLLKEQKSKYILTNYPSKSKELIEFEKGICPINKLIYVSSKFPIPINDKSTEEDLEVFFKNSGRLYCYDKKEINDFLVNEIFNKNREFSLVYGLPFSGKKVISNYLSSKYGYKIFDFASITEALKKRMAGEEGNPDEQVVDLNKFLLELREILSKVPNSQRFLLTNLSLHIKDPDHINKLIEICGIPKILFELVVDNTPLMERCQKIKNDSTEPMNEEQKEEFMKNLEIPKKIKEKLKSLAIKVFPINNSMAESTAHKFVNKYLARNYIVIKHDYDININNVLKLISTNHKVLLVNVPYLIHFHKLKNTSIWTRLNSTFAKKKLKTVLITCEEERIFYDYNPIHFSDKIVKELIENYINDNIKEIENSGNIVLLVGYLNNDLLQENDLSFNLPLYEINSLNSLGNILSFIQITRQNIETIENEEPRELEKPKQEKKEEVKDDLDKIDEENNKDKKEEVKKEEEEKKEEPNEDGTLPFHPEKYRWTFTDGASRNYIQHLIKYTKYPLFVNNITEKSLVEIVYKTLSETIVSNVNIYNEFIAFLQSDMKDKSNSKTGVTEGKISLFTLK